jgi:hypothetical protein
MEKECGRRLACHEGMCVTGSDAVYPNERHSAFKEVS